MRFNPYAADPAPVEEVKPEYAVPAMRDFTAPSLESGDPSIDEFGWAPKLRTSTTETPSAQRVGVIPRYDVRPNPERPPEEWYGRLDADRAYRASVEDQHTTGFTVNPGITPGDKRWADDPRRTPPQEPRVTNRMAPRSYSFTRFFDQFNRTHAGDPLTGSARQFNGMHFSMADHRRTYDIYGMAPVRTVRNTYRTEPVPWDQDVIDLPPNNTPDLPSARVRSVELPHGTRSWRL